MASSSRSRIDQFFPSKKRKPTDKDEKDLENSIPEVFCSAKGSLDGHQVDARENDIGGDYQFGLRGPTVKWNLTKEIGLGIDTVKSGIGNECIRGKCVTSGDLVKTGDGESELKKFTGDFLSLYFSDAPPTEILQSENHFKRQKRNDSPSFLAENEKTCLKKHCLVNGTPSLEVNVKHPQGEGSYYNHMSHELHDKACHAVPVGSAQPRMDASRDAMKCDRKDTSFSSLRKCNNNITPMSNLVKTWSSAIDPSGNVLVSHQTPKSSLKTSPGEEFWDEAIQMADLLEAPSNTLCVQIAKDYVVDDKKFPHHPCFVDNQRSSNKMLANKSMHGDIELSKSHFNEIGDHRETETGSCLEGFKNSTKETKSSGYNGNKNASPMPVKHFDFSNEDSIAKENANRLQFPDTSAHPEVPTIRNVHSRKPPISLHNVSCTSKDDYLAFLKPPQSSFLAPKNCIGGQRDGNSPLSDNIDVQLPMMKISFDYEATTPSSNKLHKDSLYIHNWLPKEICMIYTRKGMSSLYPWQVECLQIDGVLDRRNLVYCASTSAGKSFVAEILMLRRVISMNKMAILVLPYVSICAEKASHLEVVLEPLGKHVRSFYGNQGGGSLPKDTSVAVCTIEKANSLVNRLLEEGRLSEVGIIVIDELHMVGDQHRGYLLELLLTKLRYASGGGSSEPSSGESSGSSSGKTDLTHGLQIVGMSATMPNVSAVADWLQAALYQTDFRPVPLEEYIKVGNSILNRKMEIVRTFTKTSDLGGRDPDHIVELCNEIVQEGHSVLCFCSSRKGCESTAKHISKFLNEFSSSKLDHNSEFSDVFSAIEALRKSPAGLDPTLEETLPHGVAFHHAGLTVEEREIVEACYRKGFVRVLTATSTLAAGVNLPARRVIFRQPRIGRDFIDGTRYRQMAGRAGRTGIDTKGESILICKPEELKRIASILNDSCPPLQSCLSEDKNGMVHAILEVVSGGIVQTANDIHRYVRCTLLNSTKPFKDVVKSAQDSLHWLCHRKFLQWNEDTKLYSTTSLGRASFGSSLCPEESLVVLDDLSRAREGIVLASDLHLVYLVTPINVNVEPDWKLYYERFMELSPLNQSVGNHVGVAEPFLMRMAHGAPMPVSDKTREKSTTLHRRMQSKGASASSNCSSEIQILRVSKRFYVSLMLSRLVQEVPITDVCDSFKVARGMIQSLQENAGRFASMVAVFCERLGWHDLEGLIAKFQNRVSFGVRAEIVELTTIPHIKGSRARALYKAGLRTPLAIAETSTIQIAKALFEASSWAVQEDSGTRRIQLALAKKIKNGARKIVLDKAEEARLAAFSAYESLGIQVPQFSVSSLPSKAKVPEMEVDILKSCTQGAVLAMEKDEHLHVSIRPSSEHMKDVHDNLISMNCRNDNAEKVSGPKANSSSESISSQSFRNNLNNSEYGVAAISTVPLTREYEILDTNPTIGGVNEDQNYDIQGGNDGESAYNNNSFPTCDKGPINASSIPGGFDSFMHQWELVQEFYFDIHFSKKNNTTTFFDIFGLAICWKDSPIYYINLSRYLISSWKINTSGDSAENSICSESKSPCKSVSWEISKKRWSRIANVLGKNGVKKITWNLKSQMHVLQNPGISVQRLGSRFRNEHRAHSDFRVIDGTLFLPSIILNDGIDVCLIVWILWPDEESGSCSKLDKVVKKCLSVETASAAVRDGRWRNQMRKAAHNGCCLRVSQTRALTLVLWKLLVSECLMEPFLRVESPLVKVLADMEIWGIGVDVDGCLHARHILVKKLKELEKAAFELAGFSFSLYSTADIANVLYTRLKLPIPDTRNKGKQHPSTNKHSLDLLRDEHPIIPVIKEHRTLSKLLNSTLGSICTKSQLCLKSQKYIIKGHWLQTSTATGRLSMEEPNLQSVEHPVELTTHNLVKDPSGTSETDFHQINARNFFVPTQENWVLITADYSQIELRLMAHFSKDASLIELLSRPDGDVFTMLAAKWTGKLESTVKSKEREQTKRLVYGILYGMGANTLAEQLDCNPDEAGKKIQSFKDSFSRVSVWLQDAVALCRGKGYVETLLGRKRFLSKIKFGDHKEKAKAQRQAVNSICQGSAADIIKIAMINIHSVVVGGSASGNSVGMQYSMLKDQCRILLQVHDELLLEVNPSLVKEAASLLQVTMEGAASLLVPLHVKIKVGRTWGSLESFDPNL